MKQALLQAVIITLLAAAVAAAAFQLHPRAPALHAIKEPLKADEVGLKEIQARWQGDVIWLDARPRSEFDKGHIPGAHLLNLYEWDDLMPDIVQLLDADSLKSTIVIYCDGQKCAASRELRDRMNELPLGEIDIRVLHGGWPAWQSAQPK